MIKTDAYRFEDARRDTLASLTAIRHLVRTAAITATSPNADDPENEASSALWRVLDAIGKEGSELAKMTNPYAEADW
jgi:hypothetical protein